MCRCPARFVLKESNTTTSSVVWGRPISHTTSDGRTGHNLSWETAPGRPEKAPGRPENATRDQPRRWDNAEASMHGAAGTEGMVRENDHG
jgi:hypothetical protein